MNKFFQMIGGRKFALTVVSMLGAAAIDLATEKGLSMPLATFLGAGLAAFCSANYFVSKEYMRSEAEKKKGGSGSDEVKKELKALDEDLKIGQDNLMMSVQSIESRLGGLESAVTQLSEATLNTFKAANATNATLQAAINTAKKG